MYKLVIKNGFILDGTGGEGYISDIAVENGKIAEIGNNLEAIEYIDASNLTVTPGFIDSHSHSDRYILKKPDMQEKVEQGITTSIGGQCGGSEAPISLEKEPYEIPHIGKSTDVLCTMGTFLKTVQKLPQGANTATFIGHRNLRATVMGLDNRAPSEQELEKMKELLREGIEGGALGVSFGLIYPPSCFASTYELVELAKVAAEYDAIIVAHLRNEENEFEEAVEEFLYVMRKSGAKCVLSHHKAAYKQNWGKSEKTLKMVDEAVANGYNVHLDVYPYTASHTTLSARFIPMELFSGGNEKLQERLSDIKIREEVKNHIRNKFGDDDNLNWVMITDFEYAGKRLNEIAEILDKDVYDTLMDLVKDSLNTIHCCYFMMCEEDVERIIAHPRAMICTDNVPGSRKNSHPRATGAFPRAIGRYVREKGIVSLPEMIRKMTSMPAEVYGLKNKGLLKEGYDADICIFDAEKIIDKADYTNSDLRAEGLNYVLVNGEIAAKDAVYTGSMSGRVILIEH